MFSRRSITLTAALVLAGAGFVHAEPDPAAKANLDAMSKALQAAKTLAFDVDLHGEGAMFAAFVPKAKSTVLMQRSEEQPGVWMFRVSGSAEMVGQPTSEYLLVADGQRKMWIDKEQKMLFERAYAAAGGQQVDLANTSSVHDMIGDEAVAKALSAPNITAEPDVKVGGVDCNVVLVDQGDNRPPTRWSIATTDHLPRKLEKLVRGGGMNDSQVWTITNLKLNQPVPEGTFALSLLPGYTLSPSSVGAPVTGAAPRQRAVGVNPDDLAFDFELKDSAGETVKLSSLRGNVVLLDFWGTWCLPCKKASPEIQKIADDYKGKPVKVYGLAVRETSDDKPIAYMKDNKYTYGLLLKADDVAKANYKVKVFPSYFVIGKAGEIYYMTTGYDEKTTMSGIRDAINLALEGKPVTTTAPAKPAVPVDTKPAGDPSGADK